MRRHSPTRQSGVIPPIFNIGPFASMDMLFTSAAGDLDLFTDMEISDLISIGLLKPPTTGIRDAPVTLPASEAEPASSSRKRDCRDSPGGRHSITMTAGSHKDLDRSEHECEAVRK